MERRSKTTCWVRHMHFLSSSWAADVTCTLYQQQSCVLHVCWLCVHSVPCGRACALPFRCTGCQPVPTRCHYPKLPCRRAHGRPQRAARLHRWPGEGGREQGARQVLLPLTCYLLTQLCNLVACLMPCTFVHLFRTCWLLLNSQPAGWCFVRARRPTFAQLCIAAAVHRGRRRH